MGVAAAFHVGGAGDAGYPSGAGSTVRAVADDHAPAVLALRRELVNRAFETIECAAAARAGHLERFVVIVAAHITLAHRELLNGFVHECARLCERLGCDVSGWPLSAYRALSFYSMRTDALDRFGTRIEHRMTRSEISAICVPSGDHSGWKIDSVAPPAIGSPWLIAPS